MVTTDIPGMSLIPSGLDFAGAEVELIGLDDGCISLNRPWTAVCRALILSS